MTDDILSPIVRKVMWRLLPISMAMFFFSLLDRTNLSFAALEMNKDLGLSPAQYGTAASVFFIGYLLFEIPSNYMLEKFGARIWLARIMITWGMVVVAMAFIQDSISLYVLRFLLGVAEAGLLPGLLLYLSLWLPAKERGKAYAILLMTTAAAYALGAPLTTVMMKFPLGDFKGWQTMFLLQGLVTVAFGVACYFLLPLRIAGSTWLSADEQANLSAVLAQEEEVKRVEGATRKWDAFFDQRVMTVAAVSLVLVCCNFGTILWLPQILQAVFPDYTAIQISLLISLVFLVGGVVGVLVGRNSDRSGDRKWHLALFAALAGVGYALAGYLDNPMARFAFICLGIICFWSIFGVFWAYAGDLLGGSAAAGGFAFINSVGSVGGVIGPFVLGWGLQRTGNMSGALYALAVFAFATAAGAVFLKNLNVVSATAAPQPHPAQ
jgi:ACS family tartrate transporter-like MFS transporter